MEYKQRTINFFQAHYKADPSRWVSKAEFETAVKKTNKGLVESANRCLRRLVDDGLIEQTEFADYGKTRPIAHYRLKGVNTPDKTQKRPEWQFQASGRVMGGLPVEIYNYFEGV